MDIVQTLILRMIPSDLLNYLTPLSLSEGHSGGHQLVMYEID